MPRAVWGALAGNQRGSGAILMLQVDDLKHPGEDRPISSNGTNGRRRSIGQLAGYAFVGVASCYAVLFGVFGQDGTSETVQTASAERLPIHLLGADPQDRWLDALAGVASRKSQLDQKLAEQARAFDEQRLRAGRYERALEIARHDIASLKAAALHAAATHFSARAEAKRALVTEQQKVYALEDRARADESDRARLAHERLVAVQELDAAKSAVTRAEMTSQRASQQYAALERALDRAHQTWEQTAQVAAADRLALQQALDRTVMLERGLSAATDEIHRLKLREAIRYVRAGLPSDVAAPMTTVKKRAVKPPSKPKPVKLASRKTQQSTGFLPASLLPARPPLRK